MSDLGTLALGTYTNVASTTKTGADPALELIAAFNDGSYAADATNSTHTGRANFTLADVPSDFSHVDTLAIRLRYLAAAGMTNTWDTLTARVFKSDGTTALTDLMTVASNITTTTGTNSSVIPFTGVDTAATAAEWNGALVQIGWGVTRIKGGDTVSKRVTAAEVTGTYTAISIAGSDTVTVLEDVTVLVNNLLLTTFDTVTVVEAVTVEPSASRMFISSGDYIIVQEGILDQPKIVVWDDVPVSEAYGVGGGMPIVVSDDVLVQDSPAVSPASLTVALNVFDLVSVQEGQEDLNIVSVSTFDVVTVTENVPTFGTNLLRMTVNDTLSVVEQVGVFTGGPLGVVIFDGILIQEVLSVRLSLYINAVDNVAVIDGALNMDVFDAVTVVEDHTVKVAQLLIAVNETVTIVESVVLFGISHNIIEIVEELVIAEFASILLTVIGPAVSENVTVLDAVTVSVSTIDLSIDVHEDVSVIEVLVTQLNPLQIDEFTQVLVTESIITTSTILHIAVSESVTVVESVTLALSLILLDLADDVTVGERVSMRITKGGGRRRAGLLTVGAGE